MTKIRITKDFVNSAAQEAESFDNVERSVLRSVLEIEKGAMALFLSLQGHGDLGPFVETEDAKVFQVRLSCFPVSKEIHQREADPAREDDARELEQLEAFDADN
ncbi:MAG: hypothetical protein KDB14_23950 [Planctomycetales bacterium]|nr:hypothetical protein [Planctomycetales bacterium]